MMNADQNKAFDIWVIPRLILFLIIPQIITTPLRIIMEGVIEGKTGAPDFVTVPFILYGICAELVFGIGYIILGYLFPVKNTFLRAFSYIMLIFFSSYLTNILAMAGGDGEIISGSLSISIVVVDTISYVLKGLVLGFVMKKYVIIQPEISSHVWHNRFAKLCAVNGLLFMTLNFLWDRIVGIAGESWHLSSMLKVSPERETTFYVVFYIFMLMAGMIIPLWFRFCLPDGASISDTIIFGLKLPAIVWLPNVLIMIFFGCSAAKTIIYGVVYVVMFEICVLNYRKILTCHIIL